MKEKPQDIRQTPVDAATLRKRAEEQAGSLEQTFLSTHSPEEILRILHELHVHQIELEMQNEELRMARMQIEACRARYFDLYDLAPVGYCTISEKGIILETNLTFTKMLGVNRRITIEKPFSAFILSEDQHIYYLLQKESFDTGNQQTGEVRMIRSDKTTFWASLQATTLQDEDGAKCLRVIISDVSMQKMAEKKLQEREAENRAIVELVPDIIYRLGIDGQYLDVKISSEGKLASPKEVILKKNIKDVVPSEVASLMLDAIRKAVATNELQVLEYELAVPAGRTILEARIQKLTDDEVLAFVRDITKRRQAEETLQVERDLFQRYLNTVDTIIVSLDSSGNITMMNRYGMELLGYNAEQIIGKNWFTTVLDQSEGTEQVYAVFQNIIQGELDIVRHYENEVLTATGERRLIDWSNNYLYDLQGRIVGTLSSGMDITERKLVEEKIAKQNSLLAKLPEQIPGVIYQYRYHPDGRHYFPYASSAIWNVYEVTPDEVKEDASKVLSRLHPDDYNNVMEGIVESSKTLENWEDEYRVVLPKQGERWVRGIAKPEKLEDGSVLWHGYISDITERKIIEDQLDQHLKDLLESQRIAHIGTWRLDLATNQVVWSEELYKMYGFDPTLPPPPYTEHMKLFTPESWDRLSTSLEYTRTTGNPYELELKTVTIDGSNGWMWVRGEAETDSEGNIIALWGAAQDITEQKKVEHNLRSSNEQNQRILENLQDAYFQVDLAGNIVLINPAANKIFGFDDEEMIGMPAINLYADANERNSLLEEIQSKGNVKDLISKRVHKDGSIFWASLNAQFLRNEDGEVVGVEGAVRDISERIRLTEELEQHFDVMAKRLHQTVNAISKIGELRDAYTAGHQKRVAELACAIGSKMGLTDEQIHNLSFGGLIHDTGKFFIPSDILNKPGKVSDLEYKILQTHVEESYNVVKEIDFPEEIHTMIHQHHERLDGSGYPQGLSGDEIILESRIMAVADVVEAMSSHRPYRAALGIDAALEEILLHRGTKFDAEVVDICIQLIKEDGYTL
ncbi:MAG: PAS domain S-box protein [Bacteroidales bacterium]